MPVDPEDPINSLPTVDPADAIEPSAASITDVTPSSKADMDPQFEKRMRDHRDAAAAEASARTQGNQVKWMRPTGWNGDVFDFTKMQDPFNRDVSNVNFLAAVDDPANPGTAGDLAATTLMIDRLAVAERAFRMRHTMSRPRAMAHMLARRKGQGNDQGPFIQLGVEFIRNVLKQGKVPQ